MYRNLRRHVGSLKELIFKYWPLKEEVFLDRRQREIQIEGA
jgi:hypothetical protein